jgi:hypothetical protein
MRMVTIYGCWVGGGEGEGTGDSDEGGQERGFHSFYACNQRYF